MSHLEIAFYIVGIVFMGLSILILAAILTLVLLIRAKIQAINDSVREKIDMANNIAAIATPLYTITRHILKFRRLLK